MCFASITSSVWRRRLCCWWYLSFYTPNPSESRLNTLLFTSRTLLPGSDFLRVSFILNYTSLSFSFSTLLFQLRSMKTSGLLLSSYFLQFCCCSKWHKYPASAETKRCFAVKKKNKNLVAGRVFYWTDDCDLTALFHSLCDIERRSLWKWVCYWTGNYFWGSLQLVPFCLIRLRCQQQEYSNSPLLHPEVQSALMWWA